MLRRGRKRINYVIERQDPTQATIWATEVDSKWGTRITISRQTAPEWWFVGEAPVSVSTGEALEFAGHYSSMADWPMALLPQNLTQSDSGVCLAGSAVGESEARSRIAALRFEIDGRTADLAQLLTIQSWSPQSVSRMIYFNSRTGDLDRRTGSPSVVVADGDKAFLRVLGAKEFQHSDVIAVVDRTLDRERLEQVGQKLADLGQWYSSEGASSEGDIAMPVGMATRTWVRR
jgi:hypothetical protein